MPRGVLQGKTVASSWPLSAGGRTTISDITHHGPATWAKHYGNPVFVVDNMTGAGGIIGVNHVYKVAKPDGSDHGEALGTMSSIK